MTQEMFCFQCEQTAGGRGCTKRAGVCGKKSATAILQDQLTGSIIALAQTAKTHARTPETDLAIIGSLFMTITNVNFDDNDISQQIAKVRAQKLAIAPELASTLERYFDMNSIWTTDEDIRSLKALILFGLRGMAAYAYHAMVLGAVDETVNSFFYTGLNAIADDLSSEELLPLVMKLGEVNFKCMELLDRANTDTYGTPVPVIVPLTIEKGPFIVISGHDLLDLQKLLEQTEGKGVNVYTHGEMLPAHGYPKLKKFAHLKGNFGTAWQNQQKEFLDMPGAVLFTTNCIMPVKPEYADRVFTTEVVGYPEMPHIGEDKDFTPVIEKALELGGYAEDCVKTGINGGKQVTTGYGHGTILASAGKIVEGVKSGAIKHFFLVGGCDGAKTGRNYYTHFVEQTPADSIILTLACGKYRFNDLDLGTIGGLPRILDMGQCNDTYGAIRVALALAEAFECGVNELPLSIILSWYEQKAVCVLLTLLYLGIKNIRLGPSLPAFVSPNTLKFLVENFGLMTNNTPEEDLAYALA